MKKTIIFLLVGVLFQKNYASQQRDTTNEKNLKIRANQREQESLNNNNKSFYVDAVTKSSDVISNQKQEKSSEQSDYAQLRSEESSECRRPSQWVYDAREQYKDLLEQRKLVKEKGTVDNPK